MTGNKGKVLSSEEVQMTKVIFGCFKQHFIDEEQVSVPTEMANFIQNMISEGAA